MNVELYCCTVSQLTTKQTVVDMNYHSLILFGISLALSLSLAFGQLEHSLMSFVHQPPPPPPPSQSPPPTAPPTIMRAWHCHGRNQRELVDRLAQAKIVQSPMVRNVLNAVDRQYYIPQNPYQDAPQTIGYGQTISAPHMHAHVLEEMMPTLIRSSTASDSSELRILDVGCGSGYLTACLGRLFQAPPACPEADTVTEPPSVSSNNPLCKHGHVVGVDIVPRLVELARTNIAQQDHDLLDSGVVSLHVTNGWHGWPALAPYDVIHVGAAAASFPRQLAQQLKVGGLLLVPLGPNGGVQHLYKVERVQAKGHDDAAFHAEDYHITPLLGVRYVPLVEEPEVN
jgi:protein-L-isoaspartate(D-aspartate) O-methyltransferase